MRDEIIILGAAGGVSNGHENTSIKINNKIIIDAGNIIRALEDEINEIEHIFVSHTHIDHINDIPYLIDNLYEKREKSFKIYASKESITNMREHMFNDILWRDYEKINLINQNKKILEFIQIDYGQSTIIDDITIKTIQNNHTKGSCSFIITKNNKSILFTSDTYICETIYNEINNNETISTLIIECSYPTRLEKIAQIHKHLTPKLLKQIINKINRDNIKIFINHVKPKYLFEIESDIIKEDLNLNGGKILDSFDSIPYDNKENSINKKVENKRDFNQLLDIGHSLTSEKNIDALMEKILIGAINFSNADAGTLYLMNEEETHLSFKVVRTNSLNIKMGGTQGEITWPKIPLYNEKKQKNKKMVAAICAIDNRLINIHDVYTDMAFDFEGAKDFDKRTGYRTSSMLVVPMVDHEDNVIGVLQLLNKQNANAQSILFTLKDEKLIKSMSSQAAIAITNIRLIEGLEILFDSFIKSIAAAIDEKSTYTGGHIQRVAEISNMIIEAINEDDGIYKDKFYSNDQKKEIRIAAWMHDIGKISTPEYVVDKSKKLETIFNRIDLVEARFEISKLQKENSLLKEIICNECEEKSHAIKYKIDEFKRRLNENFDFIKRSNTGSEFMRDEDVLKIEEIAKETIHINDKKVDLISANEVYNLSIKKGTLTSEERDIINKHSLVSIQMLDALPYPKKFKNIPKIAGAHHEKICGGGYPYGLKGEEINFEARILALADIFEALTAHDRPYKEANSLNQAMRILSFMVKDGHLDKDIIKFFVDKKLHLQYAHKNLKTSQIDEVTVDFDAL